MKILLIIFFMNAIENTIKCDELRETSVKYPKKVKTGRNIKIINARKFEKVHALEKLTKATKKVIKQINSYTAFPPIGEKILSDEPETAYFQSEVAQRKPRVKKVLPEYGLPILRQKRSATNNNNNTEIDKVKNKAVSKDKPNKITKKKNKKKKLRRIKKSVMLDSEVPYVMKKVHKKKLSGTKENDKKSTIRLKYTRKRNNTRLRSRDKNVKKIKKANRQRPQERIVKSRRLIAGKDALIQDYPYVVSIQKGGEHWCAGALLNPRLVITTANCIWKARSISRMRIRAGSRHMERGGQVAKIQEVVKHPDWNIRSHPDNDVGLLLLDRNIKFSDSVHSVDLPNRAMWPAFEDVWVTSWGSDRRDGIFNTVGVTLQVYHAMLVNHDKCNNVTQRFGVAVTRNFICLAQTGRRAPCTRDTGAPAVSDGILWGLASWGIRKLCGTERFPAMFSYLASRSNIDFITNATHYLMSDKRDYPYPDRFAINRADTGITTGATTTF